MNNIRTYKVKDVLGYICECSNYNELEGYINGTSLFSDMYGDGIYDCSGRKLVSILQARGYNIKSDNTYWDDNIRKWRLSLEYQSGLYVNYKVNFNKSCNTIELIPVWYEITNIFGKRKRVDL